MSTEKLDMTEDDTFRILTRSSYEDLTAELRESSEWGPVVARHGWTMQEFYKEWNKRMVPNIGKY